MKWLHSAKLCLVRRFFVALAAVWIAVAAGLLIVYMAGPAAGKSKDYGMTRRISAAGLEHIKHFEGLRLSSYFCSSNVCTIGWGHTGPDVKPGMTITKERAEELLRQDLDKAERAVADLVKVQLTAGQHAAVVDLCFNIGRDAFARSTLLKLLNRRLFTQAGDQLMRWVHSGSAIVSGLQRRRLAARAMWFDGR